MGFTFTLGNQVLGVDKESMLVEFGFLYDGLYKVNLNPLFAQVLLALNKNMNVGMKYGS